MERLYKAKGEGLVKMVEYRFLRYIFSRFRISVMGGYLKIWIYLNLICSAKFDWCIGLSPLAPSFLRPTTFLMLVIGPLRFLFWMVLCEKECFSAIL